MIILSKTKIFEKRIAVLYHRQNSSIKRNYKHCSLKEQVTMDQYLLLAYNVYATILIVC
jgi:hypothetical protein